MSIRDPFYVQIEETFRIVQLDSDLFERLAAELVESKGLSTNLAIGGADNGYDFELLDTALEPGPGVVTTSDRVTTNLKRNLERNRTNCPQAAKKTFIVTSSVLTSRKRDNLKKACREKGYTYLGASDRHEIARYIYANPHWARDLLGLDGQPSALSVVPLTSRPLVDMPLVGRQDVVEHVRSLDGDAMLVGSPGAGKTAVLTQLVAEGTASFMVSTDMMGVANAIRQQSPEVVIIDDLENVVAATRELVRLRSEIGADFRIIVTDWEKNPELQVVLGLSDADIIELERLTRDEVATVVKSWGVVGPSMLVREIVDQSEGIPGLAVTLTQAALGGDYRYLFNGNRLGALMELAVNRLLGDSQEGNRAVLALGAIATSGDAGLTLEEVADFVGVSRADLQSILRRLTTGGIIRLNQRRLSLRPPPLRRYMIRKTFFDASPADYTPLIRVVPDSGELANELVLASRAGAAVPNLLELVINSGSTRAARYLAGSGEREARELLAAAPALAIHVAHEALHSAPEVIIPMLLDLAVDDTRELHNTPEQPIRLIKDWANAGIPGRGTAVSRKRTVVQSALRWAANSGNFDTSCRACAEVLRTVFEGIDTDPGAGMTITITRGMLTPAEIEELADVWARMRVAIKKAGEAPWPSLLEACGDLIHPSTFGNAPEAAFEQSRRLGRTVIMDLGELASAHPGVLDRLNTFRRELGDNEFFPVPEDYALLFGQHEIADWRRHQEEKNVRIAELAEEWATKDSAVFASQLNLMQREADIAGQGGYNWPPLLSIIIAEKVDDVDRWLSDLSEANVRPTCLMPFLERAVQDHPDDWEELALPILNKPALESVVVNVSLRAPEITDEMWSELSPRLPNYHQLIDHLCLLDQVSQATLRRLLHHESTAVTHATSVGMWNGETRGRIPDDLRHDWEHAIVQIDNDEYWLKEILASSTRMAARWLRARIENNDWRALRNPEIVESACQGLDQDQRLELLQSLPGRSYLEGVAAELIGDSDELFREVLRDSALDHHWESPLQRTPDHIWCRNVRTALEEGKTPQEVATASMMRSQSWTGPESMHLQDQIDEYSAWLSSCYTGVREVAMQVIEWLSKRRERALAEERREAIEGFS